MIRSKKEPISHLRHHPVAVVHSHCLVRVSQLSETTPKSPTRLQAVVKYLSGDAWVPFKTVKREKSR